ncbi:tumor rejection antigen P815A-like [Chionomys nivalis]|uniref:tumor rejection antigen P815A-like n=1 Tax=Chionomys nivalis TaxID=269649 RepID=UPI002592657A|nr:tumor rejection antigen P815A-like [Chionomys nivalis]
MSDKKKPDRGPSGSDGKSDGNRGRLLEQYSLEEILMSLTWLIFITAAAGFLAFQFIVNAIYEEEEYERDVAWIAKQSRHMYPTDEEDEDTEDEDTTDDDMEDEDQEELENQMEEAEEYRAEDETRMEEGARAIYLIDLATFTGVPNRKLRKNIIRFNVLNFFREPNFLVSVPRESEEEPIECECEDANEEAAEAAEEKEEEGDETAKPEGELKEDLNSREDSLP